MAVGALTWEDAIRTITAALKCLLGPQCQVLKGCLLISFVPIFERVYLNFIFVPTKIVKDTFLSNLNNNHDNRFH